MKYLLALLVFIVSLWILVNSDITNGQAVFFGTIVCVSGGYLLYPIWAKLAAIIK